MIEAMVKELHLRKSLLAGEEVHTVYFGGGTPSVISEVQLGRLMNEIHKHFSISADIEVTLEANPDDIQPGYLTSIKTLGINRLSIGIQSFSNAALKYFNRVHNAEQAKAALHLAREAGFTNINTDLIYALPEIPGYNFEVDVNTLLEFSPEHISAYTLTIEPKTVFGNWYNKGLIQAVDDEVAAKQFLQLSEWLQGSGYEHYEISNYSLPGFHSRHNSAYWEGVKYIGIGPGAHGFDGVQRYANVSNNALYINKLMGAATDFYTAETLSNIDRANELMMTSLRTQQGLNLDRLAELIEKTEFGRVLQKIEKLKEKGLVQINMNNVAVTNRGRVIADSIILDLFIDESIV